jgi:pimeloyl-ACP methyl ester carboxylesterase
MIDLAIWLFVAVILLALVSLVLLLQDRFIYFPLRYSTADLREAQILGVHQVAFQTSQGKQTAFFWRGEDSGLGPEVVWLLFGGNGDRALAWLGLIRAFSDPRSGYLLIDYPGYGICQGRPNPETILENAERALQTLLETTGWKLSGQALGVLGHSLGGAAALQFAANHPVGKILVVSTFTTMDAMVRAQIHLPLGRLLRHRFDNITALKAILSQKEVPEIRIFHGQADEIIPPKMGRSLADLDPNRIKYSEIPGASHNDILQMPLALSLQSALFGHTLGK